VNLFPTMPLLLRIVLHACLATEAFMEVLLLSKTTLACYAT